MPIREMILFFTIILVVFIFLYLPKKAQEKALKQMQEKIKKKDNIITYSGLTGQVEEITEERVLVKLDASSDICIWIEKWAIAGIDDRNKK